MIKLTNVTKIYKTGVRALNDVNLTIEPGEFVYVIGTTGAGKSTFIKLLYREEKQLQVKLKLLVKMFLKLETAKFLILEEILELYFKTLDYYLKKQFLKMWLML